MKKVVGLLFVVFGFLQLVSAWHFALHSDERAHALYGFWSGPFCLLLGGALNNERIRGWRTYTGVALAYFGFAAIDLAITDFVWGTPEPETWAYFAVPIILFIPAAYLLWRGYLHGPTAT